MAVFTVPCVSVKGISACVPLNKVSNYDCELLDEKETKLFLNSKVVASLSATNIFTTLALHHLNY
jgi:hypothetical protein